MTPAKIAVVGAGWWSQGWHLPHLHRNPNAYLVAIVEPNAHPKSNLNPDLKSRDELAKLYPEATIYESLDDLLASDTQVDGIIICTPHATHSQLGQLVLQKQIHVLMEKPFTTRLDHAIALHQAVSQQSNYFSINHSANYRPQAAKAKELLPQIGQIRFLHVFFASPLSSIFEDPSHVHWNEPSEGMLGNGFAWGQSSHVLAWIFHVCPSLVPISVYCSMTHSTTTGADNAHSASIQCKDDTTGEIVVFSLSGTSLLPGDEHSKTPIGKLVQIGIYGTQGTMLYGGTTIDEASGSLELRRMPSGDVEKPAGEGFLFEALDQEGNGPESIQALIKACQEGPCAAYVGASSLVGLRTVQVLDAMYRSNKEKSEVTVAEVAVL